MTPTIVFLPILVLSSGARAACFDAAIDAGYGFKDPLTASLVITQTAHSVHRQKIIGDTIVGIGVKGKYFGCTIPQKMISAQTENKKKFSVFLKIPDASVQGFELDILTESRRVLSGRPIQVPWDVVDRRHGVVATCTLSNGSSFEAFLYGALRNAKARRCTQPEIEMLVGPTSGAHKI